MTPRTDPAANPSTNRTAERVAITGATGMLGRHLVEHFRARGWTVHALVRRPGATVWSGEVDPRPPRCFRFEMPDVLEEGALADVRLLVHAAATTRSSEVASARGTDVAGAERLFAAAREAGVGKIVFASSTSARADAPSRYGRSKHAIEELLDPARDVALRLGLVVSRSDGGLFRRLVGLIASSPLVPLFGGGRQVVQPVHVDDVCRCVEAAFERDVGGTLVVADPVGMELRALLRGVARRLGRRVVLVPVPWAPALLGLRAIEALRLSAPVTSENLLGLAEQRFHPCAEDLRRLGVELIGAERALDRVLP